MSAPCSHDELIFNDRRTAAAASDDDRVAAAADGDGGQEEEEEEEATSAAINNAVDDVARAPAERFLTRDYGPSESSARCVTPF